MMLNDDVWQGLQIFLIFLSLCSTTHYHSSEFKKRLIYYAGSQEFYQCTANFFLTSIVVVYNAMGNFPSLRYFHYSWGGLLGPSVGLLTGGSDVS
jgi:hypothetical protein